MHTRIALEQIIATALLAGLVGMASAAAIAEDKLLALNLTGKLDMLEKLADEKTALKEKAMVCVIIFLYFIFAKHRRPCF